MRRWLVGLGVLLVAGGLVALLAPGVLAIEGADALLLIAGIAAIFGGLHAGRLFLTGMRREVSPPEVETRLSMPVPGDEADEMLALATPPRSYLRERRLLRERTYELANDALTALNGISPEQASRELAAGTWTNDPAAATFLGDEPPAGVLARLRERLARGHAFERHFRRTVEAIAERVPGVAEGGAPAEDRSVWERLRGRSAGVTFRSGVESETAHWRGVSAVALVGIGTGIVLEVGALLVAGGVGIGYVAYARVGDAPAPELSIERELEPSEPEPGERVIVRVTVTNAGDRLLPDLRLVDGVPPGLQVTGGVPRRSVALRPEESTTLRYAVEAVPGTHRWEVVTAIARSLNGSYESDREVAAATELTCTHEPRPMRVNVPLHAKGSTTVGELPTDKAGEGLEFQSVREYRPGDRLTRIDWRRYGRTKELTTVELREERATTVVVAVDAREAAYLAPDPEAPHAVEQATDAADRLVESLLEAGHRVGLTTLATDPHWLAPSAEGVTALRARRLLADPQFVEEPNLSGTFRPFAWVEWLVGRLPGDAQLVLLSPLCDALIVEAVVRLQARGYPVTIVTPDPTRPDTPGRGLVALERRVRIAKLRRRGIRVIDWAPGEPLEASLVRVAGRWSA